MIILKKKNFKSKKATTKKQIQPSCHDSMIGILRRLECAWRNGLTQFDCLKKFYYFTFFVFSKFILKRYLKNIMIYFSKKRKK